MVLFSPTTFRSLLILIYSWLLTLITGQVNNIGNKIDWSALSEDVIYEYGVQSEIRLRNVELPTDVLLCKDCKCTEVKHKEA